MLRVFVSFVVLLTAASRIEAAEATLALDASDVQPWPWLEYLPPASARLGDSVFFLHDDGLHGLELWGSDGTAPGTRLVVDLCPGRCGIELGFAGVGVLRSNGARIVFAGNDGVSGAEPWVTDGTAAGTVQLGDLKPGPDGSSPWYVTAFAGGFAFVADDGVHGRELWATDGTRAGTRLLVDLTPGVSSTQVRTLAPVGARLLVGLGGSAAVVPAVVLDSAGLVTPLAAGPAGSAPAEYGGWGLATLEDGDVLFTEFLPEPGPRLWRLDAESLGLVEVAGPDLPGPSPDSGVIAAGGGAVLRVRLDGQPYRRFAVSDGVALEVPPGGPYPASVFSVSRLIAPVGDHVVFAAFDDDLEPAQPWSWSEGDGFVQIADILPSDPEAGPFSFGAYDPFSGCYLCQAPQILPVGGRAVMLVSDAAEGRSLWATDGTPTGTGFVSDLGAPGPADIVTESYFGSAGAGLLPDESLLLRVFRPDATELWRTDGTPAGTGLVAPLPTSSDSFIVPQSLFGSRFEAALPRLMAVGGRVVVGTLEQRFPAPLRGWWVVAAEGATQLVAPASEAWGRAAAYGDVGVLVVGESGEGQIDLSLWRLDSDATSLVELESLPRPGDSPFLSAGGWLWYRADEGGLVRSDLSPSGTTLLPVSTADLVPGPDALLATGDPGHVVSYAGEVAEVADAEGPLELTFPGAAAPLGTGFVASGFREASGNELWFTDGTVEGTHLVRDIAPGPADGVPRQLFNSLATPRLALLDSDHALFAADDGVAGVEPWITDGKAAGTQRLADLRPGPLGSWPRDFHSAGDAVVFVADDGVHGREPWVQYRTGGPPELVDLAPGPHSSRPSILATTDRGVWLAAWEPTAGRELWRLDLATQALERLTDLVAGPESSSPSELVIVGKRLYFVATDGVHGAELFTLEDPLLAAIFADGFESGSTSGWSATVP